MSAASSDPAVMPNRISRGSFAMIRSFAVALAAFFTISLTAFAQDK